LVVDVWFLDCGKQVSDIGALIIVLVQQPSDILLLVMDLL
jgi:hypothetical protein